MFPDSITIFLFSESYFHSRAAARNDVDLLKAFAAAGASMTATDYSSKTPLETVKQNCS